MNRILAYGYTQTSSTLTVLLYLTRLSSREGNSEKVAVQEALGTDGREREERRGGIEKFHVAFKGSMHGKRQTWHGLNF